MVEWNKEEIEHHIACLLHPQPDMSGRQINRLHGERRRQVEELAATLATALAEARAETARLRTERDQMAAQASDNFARAADAIAELVEARAALSSQEKTDD